MKRYNIIRAIVDKKKLFRVIKGNDVRIVFASSIEQCQAKFDKWMVVKIF